MYILPGGGRRHPMKYHVIAIDGPAGSGKSTVAKQLSARLNYLHLDTGAMYRAIAHKVLEADLSPEQTEDIVTLAKTLSLSFEATDIFVNDKKVTEQIRKPDVNKIVSQIAAIPEVRQILIGLQRQIATGHHVVMEGRDIGSVVFPQADCKFYLEASVEVRAMRRYLEVKDQLPPVTFNQIKESIAQRDHADRTRPVSPLLKAPDAREIDTSTLTASEVVELIYTLATEKLRS